MAEPLFLEERRRAILEQLKRHGRVSVKILSDGLDVSAVTIRQDLRALEEDGLLERTYGGAVLRTKMPSVPELAFDQRREKYWAEKMAIGKAAAALVQNGYAIALDSSSTAYALTAYLKRMDNLTIVTNSLIIAQQFLDTPRIQVVLPGGKLRRESVSVVTNRASLPNVNLNIGFFGARGLKIDVGVTESSIEECDMKQALMEKCISTVIIVDSSKWGQVSPYTYANADEVTRIISSERAPAEFVEQFRDAGVHVDLVSL